MINTLFILQIILTVLIVIVVLMQKSSSIGLGVYSGSNDSLFGAKGPAGFMAKLTFILGVLFLANTITLGYFYNKENHKSVTDTIDQKTLIPQNPLENKLQIPNTPAQSPFEKKEK
ncbi:preprotein translocase subunit SecG [Helicobacter anatolicus]|uniref:preprotein translocase subunit SecG n=1 Tax=Helicobacter anatolicus TaxID=2905874 RepID=UPI001E486D52|nr:preprotein translocase subunit SecG [Helicobacter anatolicus]MCE3038121.1 preprotein translocase subunit SecG [Helicobacter anatolicus]